MPTGINKLCDRLNNNNMIGGSFNRELADASAAAAAVAAASSQYPDAQGQPGGVGPVNAAFGVSNLNLLAIIFRYALFPVSSLYHSHGRRAFFDHFARRPLSKHDKQDDIAKLVCVFAESRAVT